MLWMYVMQNLCIWGVKVQVKYCLYYALDYLNEAEFMEAYKNEVGSGGLEWPDIFYPGY